MASSSSATLETSAISVVVSKGLGDRIAERTGCGVPKFKSLPPPSLPILPPPAAVSPSSYFAIPRGLSTAELLDSPVLLSASNSLPSPTTGTFPMFKNQEKTFADFSFQIQTKPLTSYGQQRWGSQEPANQDVAYNANLKSEFDSMQSFSSEMSMIQTNDAIKETVRSEHNQDQSLQTLRKMSDGDGYNWRKYGQKQVKASENPRSYYKCTYPNCPVKKKVESSFEGHIKEIVLRGTHNHAKPQSSRRSSSSSSTASASSIAIQSSINQSNEISEQSYGSNDYFGQGIQKSESSGDEVDEDEPDAKKWKGEIESEGISTIGTTTVREPRVVVQTMSDIDMLDDGYRWRKYGQKAVKGNQNPRSYYKCTNLGCHVRKHVERASHDPRAVITTYEGKHNHDLPASRSRNSLKRAKLYMCSNNVP